jgi:sulfite dehydrogenase (cytochrome) subunit B
LKPLILAGLFLVLAAPAGADEFTLKLREGVGGEVVANNCAACHSLDYIVLNSPFPTRAMWQTEVAKMIKTFGADISADDAKAIVEYLTNNYGS